MSQHIQFQSDRLLIDGKPRTLLCASLFPFRVPRAQWHQRLEAVRNIGYHAVDVYIPWNYHETAPGVWDFTGQRDIEEFLRLTHEAGLYALVRPGPYICSEWDGGAIPAWVATDPQISVRQDDTAFLNAVKVWYDHILPIIARQQYAGDGEGGPVILVQADNELDFFACRNPHDYIGALAAMMRDHGITVPIIACAGQGDMQQAFGNAEGVAPAVNLYPGDGDVDVDEHVRYHRRASDAYGMPLVVTETNRWHRTLRRLVGNGARFIGPYLQVSGWDFDYGTSVNNWGDLESFMTHDYDFGGVIDPAGQERADADDARRLSAIIEALGERLAVSTLDGDGSGSAYVTDADGQSVGGRSADVAVGALALGGGGRLITITNVSNRPEALRMNVAGIDARMLPMANVPAGAGMMVVQELPLGEGLLLAATNAELVGLDDSTVRLAAPTMAPGTVWAALRIGPTSPLADAAYVTDGDLRIRTLDGAFDDAPDTVPDNTLDNTDTVLLITGTQGSLTWSDSTGRPVYSLSFAQPETRWTPVSAALTTVTDVQTADAEPHWISRCPTPTDAAPMEDWGVYTGTARYVSAQADMGGATGVVLRSAADIVSVRSDGATTGWLANGGNDLWIPFDNVCGPNATGLEITARIWGHSNFDDTRLDALQLNANRGIRGALAVDRVLNIGSGWLTGYDTRDDADSSAQEDRLRARGLVVGNTPQPRSGLGGRSTTVWPHTLAYTRRLHVGYVEAVGGSGIGDVDAGMSAALHVENGQTRSEVLLNGTYVGAITPLTPTLWLGQVHDGDELTVVVYRMWGESAGRPTLLVGHEIGGWTLESQGIPELRAAGNTAEFADAHLPFTIDPGKGRWLRINADDLAASVCSMNTVVRFVGDGVQLTAFTDAHCLGRVVLGGLPGTTFGGGRGDLFLVPEGEGDLLIYAESTRATAGTLESITLGGPVDR